MFYQHVTDHIMVTVYPEYDEKSSNPDNVNYVWVYNVTIENKGKRPVQLIARHWNIIDGHGMIHEVIGDGVVGKQPLIKPREAFEYSSNVSLSSVSGMMVGNYQMQYLDNNEQIKIAIPAFALDVPQLEVKLN
jgi:ApaG protein